MTDHEARKREVVAFYVTRETDPTRWYPVSEDGWVDRYNDLPAEYAGNVNTEEPPYDRVEGEEPRLAQDEIEAVVAFLEALTDGYQPEQYEHQHTH